MPVTTSVVTESIRKRLTDELQSLIRRHGALSEQIRTTIDAEVRLVQTERIEGLEEEMFRCEAKLADLNRADASKPARQQRALEEEYRKIDFAQAMDRFDAIFRHVREEGRGALLLLPDGNNMRTNLLLQRIVDSLQGKNYNRVRRYPITIESHSELTDRHFLSKLGSYLDLPLTESRENSDRTPRLESQTELLVNTMLGSLDFTEAALVEVEVAERFFDSADFVEWLVTKFWKKLKLRLHQLAVDEESHVICIMVITALEGFPNPTPSSELYCRSESIEIHDLERIICLPLTRWSSDEIDQWLGGLSFVNDHKTRAEIKREAERLYRLSNHGIPTHVCARLDDFFSKLSASPTT